MISKRLHIRSFVLLLIILQSYTHILSQEKGLLDKQITISITGQPLTEAIDAISATSGIHFSYSNTQIPDKEVSVEAENMPISELLDILFKGTNIRYKVVNNYIILKAEDETPKKKRQGTP